MANNPETPDRIGRTSRTSGANPDIPTGSGRLMTLDEADYEVAEGFPDPRGWDVLANDRTGPKVGKVDELLADPEAQRVRYLVVKLDKNIARDAERKVLVPVGIAQLDDDDDKVIVPGRGPEFFTAYPAYEPGQFSRSYEDRLREYVTGAPISGGAAGRDYYAGEPFDERRLFRERARGEREVRIPRVEEELAVGKRPREVGEVDVRKRVETEHVSEEVPVTREEVEVERHPVEGRPASAADMQEGEIRVPLVSEEAVVEKRPVVKEEYVIRKRLVRDKQAVEADLHRERIDVERQGEGGRTGRERTRPSGDEPRAR